ncbi:hypothetical protein EAH85_18070 [Curtobacterium flaccumfaciens]|nr:hypothetical protein EAH85_18070 [Curtobacterium flaccumfaciens]
MMSDSEVRDVALSAIPFKRLRNFGFEGHQLQVGPLNQAVLTTNHASQIVERFGRWRVHADVFYCALLVVARSQQDHRLLAEVMQV